MKTFSTIIFCFFAIIYINAQEVIKLKNPSFEMISIDKNGKPICCGGAHSWFSCGKPNLNTPDAQPGNFGVSKSAKEGNYYLGFVARDNETSEAISQGLETPLQSGKEYWISLALAKSNNLVSVSRITKKESKYDKALKLRIWGGDGYCNKIQLLAESNTIDHTDWSYYDFNFIPEKSFTYITLEAFYVTPTLFPYNGNLLMDDVSPIIPTSNAMALNEELKMRKLQGQFKPPGTKSEETGYKILSSKGSQINTTRNLKTPKYISRQNVAGKLESLIIKQPSAFNQIKTSEIDWKADFKLIGRNQYKANFNAVIKDGWKLYSQFNYSGNDSTKVRILYDLPLNSTLLSKAAQEDNTVKTIVEPNSNSEIKYFTDQVNFSRIFDSILDETKPISGIISYTVFNDEKTIYKELEFALFPGREKVIITESLSTLVETKN